MLPSARTTFSWNSRVARLAVAAIWHFIPYNQLALTVALRLAACCRSGADQHPETGKRKRMMRLRAEWLIAEQSELRIVEDVA